MKTQYDRLADLLRSGCTSMAICRTVGTVSPHRRLYEMKLKGWTITKKKRPDGLYCYTGKPPKHCK